MTLDIPRLRVRIIEMESRNMSYAPPRVQLMWEFDLKALKMLLKLMEGEGNAGKL